MVNRKISIAGVAALVLTVLPGCATSANRVAVPLKLEPGGHADAPWRPTADQIAADAIRGGA